jgi:alkylation response protein AidB-like acyl-CoA dehydrogenase
MAAAATSVADDLGRAAEELLRGVLRRPEVQKELAASPTSLRAWTAVRDAGWGQVLVAEEKGGLGLGLTELGPIFTAAGRHLLPGPLLEETVVAPLLGEGPGLALVDSDALGTPALTLGANRAVRGRVSGVRFGACASRFAIVVGEAIWVVDAAATGVSVVEQATLDVTARSAIVTLDDVLPTAACVIEEPGIITGLRDSQRLMVACELTGIADYALAAAVAYSRQRKQFGRSIGSFQAVQHILAEMVRRSEGLSALCRESVAAATRTPSAAPTIARIAKAYAGRAARDVVEGSMQVHGGIAFTTEHELHRYYTHTLALEPLYGGPRALAREVGRTILRADEDPWPQW